MEDPVILDTFIWVTKVSGNAVGHLCLTSSITSMLAHTTVISPLASTRAPEGYLSVHVVICTQKTEGSPYNLGQTISFKSFPTSAVPNA